VFEVSGKNEKENQTECEERMIEMVHRIRHVDRWELAEICGDLLDVDLVLWDGGGQSDEVVEGGKALFDGAGAGGVRGVEEGVVE
jgi:hypothetical protein